MNEEVTKSDELLQLITKELSSIMDNRTPTRSTVPTTFASTKVTPFEGGTISDVEDITPRLKNMPKRSSIITPRSFKEGGTQSALRNDNLVVSKEAARKVDATVQRLFGKSKVAMPKIEKNSPKKSSQKPININSSRKTIKEQVSQTTTETALDELVTRTADTESARRMLFLESQASKCIDADLQRMQLDLKQSYDLFQSIGEKFNSIDFSSLRNRISDLHVHNMDKYMKDEATTQLHKEFEQNCIDKRLDKLTNQAGQNFRRHPGEFGDIPELSAFFQACTQLEHGLDNLKKQREQSQELEKRMSWATEIAYERMEEIRNAVGNSPTKNF